jgi:hypothetical protein
MSRPFLKKIALTVGGVSLSVLLTALVLGLTDLATPGAYVVRYFFPPGAPDPYDLGMVLLVHLGTDFFCCFALLSVLYLLFTRLLHGRKRRSES